MSIMDDKALRRFLVKVDKQDNGCWIWTAGLTSDGYGQFSLDGRPQRAHRVSYEHYVGEIPDGMLIRHKCDVPTCVAPEHIEVGTYKQNTADMYERNRQHNHHFRKKEFCKRGHPLAEGRHTPEGRRVCRPCVNMLARKYRAAKKTVS